MILVTGATGFVGRHLMRRLLERGETVRPLVSDAQAAERLRGPNVEPAVGDVTDSASLAAAMQGVDAVIHLVAIIIEKGSATFERINAEGTRHVVEAARAAGVGRFVHMSANGAQDNPRYPYLRSKWQGEQAVVDAGIPYSILRPSLIFGRGDQFFTTLATLVRLNPVVPIVGDGKTRFQPIWVEDVCTCLSAMLDADRYLGHAYNVGGPEYLTYEELVDVVMRVLGKRRPKIHLPVALMKPAAALMEAVLPQPPVTPGQLDLLEIDNIAEIDVLPRLFGIEQPAYLQAKLGYIGRAG